MPSAKMLIGIRRLSDRIDTTLNYFLIQFTINSIKGVMGEVFLFWSTVILLGLAKITSLVSSAENTNNRRVVWILGYMVMIATSILAQLLCTVLIRTCGVDPETMHGVPVVRIIGAFVTLSGLLTVITVAPSNVLASNQLNQCIKLILYVYADTMQALFENNTFFFMNPILLLLVLMAVVHAIKQLTVQFFDKHFEFVLRAMAMMKCNLVVAWIEEGKRPDIVLGYILIVIYVIDVASSVLFDTDDVRDYLVFISVNRIHAILVTLSLGQWFWFGSLLMLLAINVFAKSSQRNTLLLEITVLLVAREITTTMQNRVKEQDNLNAFIAVFLMASILQLTRIFFTLT